MLSAAWSVAFARSLTVIIPIYPKLKPAARFSQEKSFPAVCSYRFSHAFKCKETNDRCDLNIALEKATIAVVSLWMLICFNVTALKEKRRNNKRKQKRVETSRNDELLMCFSCFVFNIVFAFIIVIRFPNFQTHITCPKKNSRRILDGIVVLTMFAPCRVMQTTTKTKQAIGAERLERRGWPYRSGYIYSAYKQRRESGR